MLQEVSKIDSEKNIIHADITSVFFREAFYKRDRGLLQKNTIAVSV